MNIAMSSSHLSLKNRAGIIDCLSSLFLTDGVKLCGLKKKSIPKAKIAITSERGKKQKIPRYSFVAKLLGIILAKFRRKMVKTPLKTNLKLVPHFSKFSFRATKENVF